MILVRIDLISAVDSSRSRELGRMYIANNGERSTLDPKLGDYDVAVCRRGSSAMPQPFDEDGPKPTRWGMVRDYPRLAYNVWRLIARACVAAFPEERALKPGTTSVLSPEIMTGLRAMSEVVRESMKHGFDLAPGEARAIEEASRWIESGLDHDTEVG